MSRPLQDGKYRISNERYKSHYLTAVHDTVSTRDNATSVKNDQSVWHLRWSLDKNSYTISYMDTGNVLDLANEKVGANVVTHKRHNGPNQDWKIKEEQEHSKVSYTLTSVFCPEHVISLAGSHGTESIPALGQKFDPSQESGRWIFTKHGW